MIASRQDNARCSGELKGSIVFLEHNEQGERHLGGDWRGGWGQSLEGLEDHD